MDMNPYLIFDGRCEEAFLSYQSVLGGRITAMMTHAGSPMAGQSPPEWQNKILHACLDLGDRQLMASDAPPERYRKPQGFAVNLGPATAPEAERIFAALSEGGAITMPLQQTFWATRFGMFEDRFGIPWMINCNEAA